MSPQKIAFLFPGQGSQAVGMGRDAAGLSQSAAGLFDDADRQLGLPLSDLCFHGPEEQLRRTENTQPALFVSSAATFQVLREAGISPFAVAGHSLGEYSALFAAGVFDFATGLSLVRTRGEAFASAGAVRPGTMAAILGLPIEKVREICNQITTADRYVGPANLNEPMQTVISGDPEAIDQACEAAKAAGAKRALVLPVSGAFHSPVVEPAAQVMRQALAEASMTRPNIVFVNNVDAEMLEGVSEIRDSLVRQVTGSVRWVETIERLAKEGITAFVEVGSGKALCCLVRRIAKDIPCHTTESTAAIEATVGALV